MASLDERLGSRTGTASSPEDSEPDGTGRDAGGRDAGGRDAGGRDGGGQPNWLMEDRGRETALSPYLPERWRGARVDPGRRGLLALAGVGLVVVLLAAYGWLRDAPTPAPVPSLPVVQPIPDEAAATSVVAEPQVDLVVSVVGLVVSSGLVHLPLGSRVADALAAAGGVRDGADVLALNLAAKVEDGDQIVVGQLPPEGRPVVSGTTNNGGGAGSVGPSTPDAAEGGTVNLNDATEAALDALPGVGPVTAANIIAWRDVNGPFTSVEQLSEVDGIGPVRLEKLRDQVSV